MDSSSGTSTQTIVNNIEQCKAETMEKDSETDSDKESVHSNWSKLLPINNAPTTSTEVKNNGPQMRKKTIKNIVLVPYKPKPKDWGSWEIKSPYLTSIIASPPLDINQIQIQNQNQNHDQNNGEMSYVTHSPYYVPAHVPEFYEDE